MPSNKLNIIGMKGYKNTGFFQCCVGIIEKCDSKGFNHLYRIIFEDGKSVVAGKDDITVIHDILFRDSDSSLIINGLPIVKYFQHDITVIMDILRAVGISYHLEFEKGDENV